MSQHFTFPEVTNRRDHILQKLIDRSTVSTTSFYNGTPCWEWQGPTSGDGRGGGYGRFCVSGQTCATHLVSYTHFHGYIPGKKQVDHLCCNRACWNPDHLELVTHLQNQRRRAKAKKALAV